MGRFYAITDPSVDVGYSDERCHYHSLKLSHSDNYLVVFLHCLIIIIVNLYSAFSIGSSKALGKTEINEFLIRF